jgi:hypothetical protein
LVRTAKQVGTAPALVLRGSRTYSDLGKEEPTMRKKMAKLAKQSGKLLTIELFVPGGTLVVLAILLARGGKSMTDTVMIVGLISALVLNLWGAALSVISGSSQGAQLHRKGGENMTRNVMVAGLIAALVLSLGGAALSVAPAWAEVKASESEVLALKQEVATSRAQRQKLSLGTGVEAKRFDLSVTPDCASRPEALIVIEAALGLCK